MVQNWFPLAVAGFASGWMLCWGLAAAIPIVLHYFYRRRQSLVRWGAMKLLMQVIEREAKRVNFEQWLLLIVRTLVLLVLAIALARPFWLSDDPTTGGEAAEPATNWILAIDVSYSMSCRNDNETRLHAAQRRALEFIEAAGPSDPIAIVALGQPASAPIAVPSYDRSAVIAAIERLSINEAGCDVNSGLQLISDIAFRAQQAPAQIARIRIVILSDLGADHWQTAIDGPEAKRLRQLGEKYPIEFESLADGETDNLAVTNVRTANNLMLLGQPVEVDVTVANYSETPVVDLPVQLSVDDTTLASQRIEVAARGRQTVRFSLVPSHLGLGVLAAAIPNDRLAVDNRRLQVIEVAEDYDVLFVEPLAGDARILQLGLRPEGENEQNRARSTVSSMELATVDLAEWQVVVLCDLGQVDTAILAKLDRYVRQGGTLICLWGPRTSAMVWNEQQLAVELLGFKFLEPSAEKRWEIDPLDYQSPLVSPFAGFPDSGLLTTPIFRFWKIEPQRSQANVPEGWQIDLATDSGDPLVVRHRLGGGNVTSLLSAPHTGSNEAHPWNAMAAWPSFVPLMQRLVQTAVDHSVTSHSLLAGQPLVGNRLRGPLWDDETRTVTITKPDGSEVQLAVEDTRADASVPWTFSQTQHSGVYWVTTDKGERTVPFVVNVDGSESDLRSLQVDQLPRSTATLPRAIDAPQTHSQVAESSPWLTRAWLFALGVLLLFESWLAWVMGRRGR